MEKGGTSSMSGVVSEAMSGRTAQTRKRRATSSRRMVVILHVSAQRENMALLRQRFSRWNVKYLNPLREFSNF